MRKALHTARDLALGGVAPRLHMAISLMRFLREHNLGRLAAFVSRRLQVNYGLFISSRAVIAPSVKFKHPTGIVIGDGVVIRDNVVIYQHVTLGGARSGDAAEGNYPTIESGATLFAGAVVVGRVRIGRSSVIGANSVVLGDVPDYATAVGAPARIVSTTKGNQHE